MGLAAAAAAEGGGSIGHEEVETYSSARAAAAPALWVFGYSSLIWKAGFEFDQSLVGCVKGYRRAFHLGCYDHRGTPEFPARVAMLEREDGAVCWGVAYSVKDPEKAKEALKYLEKREYEYDMKVEMDVFAEQDDDTPVVLRAMVFMCSPHKAKNKQYLGGALLIDMATQMALATGPSGSNRDYLFRLVEALKVIGHEDGYVTKLAKLVRSILIRIEELNDRFNDSLMQHSQNNACVVGEIATRNINTKLNGNIGIANKDANNYLLNTSMLSDSSLMTLTEKSFK